MTEETEQQEAGPLDVDGWPIRVGQRIRVRGVAGVPGGAETSASLGEVLEIKPHPTRGHVIRYKDEATESQFHYTVPERVRVRTQTKEEREQMAARLRRQRILAEEAAAAARKAAARARR